MRAWNRKGDRGGNVQVNRQSGAQAKIWQTMKIENIKYKVEDKWK